MTMDHFGHHRPTLPIDAPGENWFAVTAADADLAVRPRGLWIAGGGTVVLRGENGVDATFTVTGNTFLPVRPKQVRAASTATGIVAIY